MRPAAAWRGHQDHARAEEEEKLAVNRVQPQVLARLGEQQQTERGQAVRYAAQGRDARPQQERRGHQLHGQRDQAGADRRPFHRQGAHGHQAGEGADRVAERRAFEKGAPEMDGAFLCPQAAGVDQSGVAQHHQHRKGQQREQAQPGAAGEGIAIRFATRLIRSGGHGGGPCRMPPEGTSGKRRPEPGPAAAGPFALDSTGLMA
jgi:hypothetical protein